MLLLTGRELDLGVCKVKGSFFSFFFFSSSWTRQGTYTNLKHARQRSVDMWDSILTCRRMLQATPSNHVFYGYSMYVVGFNSAALVLCLSVICLSEVHTLKCASAKPSAHLRNGILPVLRSQRWQAAYFFFPCAIQQMIDTVHSAQEENPNSKSDCSKTSHIL